MIRFPIDMLSNIETPIYYYDMELLKSTLLASIDAMSVDSRFKLHYAIKANNNPEILKIIAKYSIGADCVSGGEILTALECGFHHNKIVFAGVGKTDKDIKIALKNEIECFNVESLPELENINSLAIDCGTIANIALRVNPEIDAHTHKYITTGTADNKFGISLSQLDHALELTTSLDGINLRGLHFHIGSQMLCYDSFKLLCDRIKMIVAKYLAKGFNFEIINVGGGLGVDYKYPDKNLIPDFKGYFDLFHRELKGLQCHEIHFELGRAIVAQCGSLISRVLYIKETPNKNFAIIDAGMNDLIRPALYQAHHEVQRIDAAGSPDTSEHLLKYDVVGPVCESSDCFGEDICLPILKRGDLVAIRSAGAYGETMASQYNMRPLPGSIFK